MRTLGKNMIELFNEFSISIAIYCYFLMSDYLYLRGGNLFKEPAGWALVSSILFNIVINTLVTVIGALIDITLAVIRLYRRFCPKKNLTIKEKTVSIKPEEGNVTELNL